MSLLLHILAFLGAWTVLSVSSAFVIAPRLRWHDETIHDFAGIDA